ncbi:MAG: type II toxin-antitoxin system RelE/ParE family toxin [Rhodocyclales bacterium]|nr:type II toxin-antitoxin system RelE/ParE family toxin [Rhodocyclales bacterium]
MGKGVRSWPTSTPYILYYLARKAGGITILRVLHHARDILGIEF